MRLAAPVRVRLKNALGLGFVSRNVAFKLVAAVTLTLGALGATGCASDVEDPVVNPGDEPQQAPPATPFTGDLRNPSDTTTVQPGDVGNGIFDVGGQQPGVDGPIPAFRK